MAAGGILAALAFVMAGLLQLKVNETMEPKPAEGNIFIQRIGNSTAAITVSGLELLPKKNEWPAGNYTINGVPLNLQEKQCGYVIGVFDRADGDGQSIDNLFPFSCEKSDNGRTKIYWMVERGSALNGTDIYVIDHNGQFEKSTIGLGNSIEIKPGFISYPDYIIAYGNCHENSYNATVPVSCDHHKPFNAQMGAAYVWSLDEDSVTDHQSVEHETTLIRPNSVKMLWQLPQFFVITIGEVLFSVTGLEFSYSQAAPSMKSVLQAFWLLTTFFGNVIDMGISGTHVIKEPATEFFFYAALMAIVISVFIAMSMSYTYVDEHAMEANSMSSEEDPIEQSIGKESPESNQVHKRTAKRALTPPPLSSVSPSEKDSRC